MSKQDLSQLGFEEAMTQLEQIVKQLETGATRLDDAIVAYEQGVALRQHCETKLKEAQMRVERIVMQQDGTVSTQSMEEGK